VERLTYYNEDDSDFAWCATGSSSQSSRKPVNVALSHAKRKLLIVANRDCVKKKLGAQLAELWCWRKHPITKVQNRVQNQDQTADQTARKISPETTQ